MCLLFCRGDGGRRRGGEHIVATAAKRRVEILSPSDFFFPASSRHHFV
jgi:hypothetical protein